MKFDEKWAAQKLDMQRRDVELRKYISDYLPELNGKGLVIDIGCGPGDFLHICKEMGHRVIGVDAPNGKGGMGDAYLNLCRKHRKKFGVEVKEYGFSGFVRDNLLYGECRGNTACVNMRGSIEQCLSNCVVGESHDRHHKASLINWNKGAAPTWFEVLFRHAAETLRQGGVLMIHANGTKSTDEWYDSAVRDSASKAGLELVLHEQFLIHKWRKP